MKSVVVVLMSLLVWRVAAAQTPPQMQAQVDPGTVGVGDRLHVQMTATSGDAMPSDPQLGGAPGFAVRGHSTSPSQTHISVNGSSTDRYTLTTTWALQAQRVGTFRIGPPTVVVGGVRYAYQPLSITVVPAGQAPRPPPQQRSPFPPGFPNPFGTSPFDPWKGLFPFDTSEPEQAAPQSVSTDPKLSLDAPRASSYFLHATVDRANAVVGEQVTFSVYLYVDPADIPGDLGDEGDPTAADFLKHALLREDQPPPLAGYAAINGRAWEVKLVRRWALFALRSGDLEIGPMRMGALRPQGAMGVRRNSEALLVHVREPPLAGRPPGYTLGDVGHFSLAAQVSPREVDEGGAVAVHVELSGTGNVPSAIATPLREGVEWLVPDVHDDVGARAGDVFGGKRTFDFVVRLRRPGVVGLGDLTLPFWDPDQKKYAVARASLGVVQVARSAASPSALSAAGSEREILPGLPAPRLKLEGSRRPQAHADDSAGFWIGGIGVWPVAFGAALGGRAAARRVAAAWRRRRMSPATELRERWNAAGQACSSDDPRTADAAIGRALEAAALAHAGVNVRGAVGLEVIERLTSAGVARDAASSVAELLRECEAARFAPDSADIGSTRDRWSRAKGAIRSLEARG